MEIRQVNIADINAGVVGLGLMGSSIVCCLLVSGHRVKAIAPIHQDSIGALVRIEEQLAVCRDAGLLSSSVASCLSQLTISEDYKELADCSFVLECVMEKIEIKKQVYEKIVEHVTPQTIIASNTSALPIGALQKLVAHPERFLGIHWAEPAYMTRFLEITCGEQTDPFYAAWVFELAHQWRKEPTLLKKDIRGFITNRLMYALYREALQLAEKGDATIEDIDKALKYDFGSWITLMGIFRRMDFTGLKDFEKIFHNSFPALSNRDDVPLLMQQMVDSGARGVKNLRGLYQYTAHEGVQWSEAFALFNRDIYRLAELYPAEALKKSRLSKSMV